MGDATVDDELPVKSLVLWHSNGITSLYHQYKFPAKNVGHPLKRRGTQWQRPTLTKNEMTNKKNVFVNFHIVSSFCRYKRIQKFCYFMAHPKNLECGPHFLENKLRLNPYVMKEKCAVNLSTQQITFCLLCLHHFPSFFPSKKVGERVLVLNGKRYGTVNGSGGSRLGCFQKMMIFW